MASPTVTKARGGVPPIVWVLLITGVLDKLERFVESLAVRRRIAFVRIDHWARRHGL